MARLEFYIGVAAVGTEDQEAEARRILSGQPFVPIDAEISMRARRRTGELGATQVKKEKVDAAINVTANVEREPFLARNAGDFEKLGFKAEAW